MTGLDSPQVLHFKQQVLTDTGYCARHLLGWNFDRVAGRKTNVGTGGIRQTGPHQQQVRFIDEPGDQKKKRFKLLLAPRDYAYKSTTVQSYIVRRLLQNPNLTILYGSVDDTKSDNKSLAVRNSITSKRVEFLFGPQRGEPWNVRSWSIASRTDVQQQNQTFTTFTTGQPATGGHFDIIVFDDPIDEEWLSDVSMEKAKVAFQQVYPLLEEGGELIVVGTLYGDNDLFQYIKDTREFEILSLGAGDNLEISQKADGSYGLDGEVMWPNMTKDGMEQALRIMQPRRWLAQYMNRIGADLRDLFARFMFQPVKIPRDKFYRLSGYLLVDSATAVNKNACHTAMIYVGLDERRNIYVLDMRVGRWHPSEVVQNFFEMLATWQHLTNHQAETMEVTSANQVYMSNISYEAAARGVRVNVITLTRHGLADSKNARIRRMEVPFRGRRIYVADTVPRFYKDLDGEKLLWNPEGHYDAKSHSYMPDGEFVNQFLRLGVSSRRDLADAFSDIEAIVHKTGAYICPWRKYKEPVAPWDLASDIDDGRTFRDGKLPDDAREDWFVKTAGKLGLNSR